MPYPRAYIPIMVAVIVAFTGASLLRNQIWQDRVTVWQDTIAKSPGKARPYFNLGCVYALQGKFVEALDMFDRSIALDPAHYETYNRRGNTYDDLGMTDKALMDYNRVIRMAPDFAEVYYDRGLAFERMGKIDDARSDYNQGCERSFMPACKALERFIQQRRGT